MTKADLPEEVRQFFAEIGRKNGKKLFAERGSEYFKKIASKRKTHGRQGKETGIGTYRYLANLYGVSSQRIQQIIKSHGEKLLDKSTYVDEVSWREAVIKKYFAKKK